MKPARVSLGFPKKLNLWGIELNQSGKNRLHRAKTLGLILSTLVYLVGCTGTSDSLQPSTQTSNASTSLAPQKIDDKLQLVAQLPAPSNTNGGKDQLIAPNDLLEVDVFQVDTLDKVVRVDASGRISLPLIGGVQASGKTLTR